MALIKSISGIRGTIGGQVKEGLSPVDVVELTAAYAQLLKALYEKSSLLVITGRDGRPSGPMVHELVNQTLVAMGCQVLDLGLSTTPTVEMAVLKESADGGVIVTASHNPIEWNALKLLNNSGEFLTHEQGAWFLKLADKCLPEFVPVSSLGNVVSSSYDDAHIDAILDLPLVDRAAIASSNMRVAVDGVNSVGGVIVPKLLKRLGVKQVVEINCEVTGQFNHPPEPLESNLQEVIHKVKEEQVDVGFVVDPDVDRLAIIADDGSFFGEEYTLVACADYVLSHTPGDICANLSGSQAVKRIAEKHKVSFYESAVGEVNVVQLMKEKRAVIGGEGNGGVIYPELHLGRDALVGIALFLSHLANYKGTCSELRAEYPTYFMEKRKVSATVELEQLKEVLSVAFPDATMSTVDGLKLSWDNEWFIVRASNTEPIFRIYAESVTQEQVTHLADKVMALLGSC